MDSLEVPGSPETTERLLQKRKNFLSIYGHRIGLTTDLGESLPQFFSLLFPAFQKRVTLNHLQSPSFVQSACLFLLDTLRRLPGYSHPLFPAQSKIDNILPTVHINTTLNSSNAKLRSALKQSGTMAVLNIIAEMGSRLSQTTEEQQQNSTLSTQHPFIQLIARTSTATGEEGGQNRLVQRKVKHVIGENTSKFQPFIIAADTF